MAISQKVLMTAVMPIAVSMARGTSRVGFTVSSASPPAVSKPYSTQAPVSMEARKAPVQPHACPTLVPPWSNRTARL